MTSPSVDINVFTGNSVAHWKIEKFAMSRYGRFGLFFTKEKEHAYSYAKRSALASGKQKHDRFVYEVTIAPPSLKVDFKNNVSYCREFRTLFYKLSSSGHKVVEITNVIDFPGMELDSVPRSIIIVFDYDSVRKISVVNDNFN